MFDLETTAHSLAIHLLRDLQFDTDQKGKIEYGIALLLGVATELVLTVAVSALLGTALVTLMIMLSALSLRLFTGGAHCSSFRRCLVFTMVCFIGLSFFVKVTAANMEFQALMWVSLILVLVALPFIWKPKHFTLLVWAICVSFPIWGMLSTTEAAWRILTLPVAVGLVLQSFMLSSLGQNVVLRSDKIMQRIGI